ncbi:MAG: short-chain dehydrogenase [Rhodomicrobium sp.]|nr:MAG: short-chain dehydrogenase [Rhodomicrobium sp.]
MATVVITGANKGIGLELAKQYAARGDEVIAAVRKTSDELDATGAKVHVGVDVSDDQSVLEFKRALGDTQIDVLINNAGILSSEDMIDMNYDRIRRQFEVNTLGPLRVTHTLCPLMVRGSKVGIVSSRVGSITDNGGGGNYGYRISKTAVNMVGKNLSIDLEPRGISLVLLHPGYVATDMVNFAGPTPPEDAAKGLIDRMDNVGLDQTGTFWHAEGYELPW